MITNRITATLRLSTLTLAATTIAILALANAANAQYKPTGDDGITASPKVRQMLNERQVPATKAAAEAVAMTCPKCADVRTSEINRQAKGAEQIAGAATSTVTRHTCAGCEVKWTVVGEGKAKHSVAIRTCTAAVPNNLVCCAPK